MPYLALWNPAVAFREGRNRQRDTAARGLLTHDTTRPLKQGSLALSSEISSFTTLQRGEEAVRDGSGISEGKETFPGGRLYPAPGSPGSGTGQGEDGQLPVPTVTTGLEGGRQGQNKFSCGHQLFCARIHILISSQKKFRCVFPSVCLFLKKFTSSLISKEIHNLNLFIMI